MTRHRASYSSRFLAAATAVALLFGSTTILGQDPASADATFTITEFPLLSPGAMASHLAATPDGNAWVGLRAANKIARITPAGVITEFTIPTPSSFPSYLTPGPDGNIWFTEGQGDKIGRITPSGAITEFPTPTPDSAPSDITVGPGGDLWFSEAGANKIGRITMAGAITEFPIPTPNSNPQGIAAGPDGNLWISLRAVNKIARMTPAGVFTEFTIPTPNSDTDGIELGPDGNMWFGEVLGNKIGRITMGGVITEFPIPTPGSRTSHVSPGPDGNMWFTESDGDKVGRITLDGVITEFDLPGGSGPHFLETSPQGHMWVTERDSDKVAKIQIPLALAVAKDGSGTGSVTSEPEGIACGNACSDEFLSGTVVTLTATPDSASTFAGWSGACEGAGVICEVTMGSDAVATATFGLPKFKLTVVRKGKGKVTSTPAGIKCGRDCKHKFTAGTEVSLSKKPKRGWKFVKWLGACTGKKSCIVEMTEAATVTARFKRR